MVAKRKNRLDGRSASQNRNDAAGGKSVKQAGAVAINANPELKAKLIIKIFILLPQC
jgi:hypothetical protein